MNSSVIKSASWIFLERFGTQLIQFFIQILLARVLLPEDFGLVAMISIVISLGQSLNDSGMTQSIIRSKSVTDTDYSTVFYANIVFSLCIYLIIYFTAPLVASFYGYQSLTSIVRTLSLKIIIQAIFAIQVARLTKSMDFKRQFIVQLPSLIVSGVAGVILAFKGFGVWSLVYMTLIQVSLVAIQYWFRSDWKPHFQFDIGSFKGHFSFGYKLALSGMLNVLFSNLYNVIIGKYFSATQLGYYNRAFSLRQLPIQNISATMNKLTLPIFAEIQDDNKKLKLAYSKVIQVVFFATTPLLVFGMVLAEPLILVLLTEKWIKAVPFFQLLCISGLTYPLSSYNLNILKVKGRSDLFLKVEIIKKVIQIVGVALVIPFGIMPLLWFQAIFALLAFGINSYYSGKMISLKLLDQLRSVAPIFFIALSIGVLVFMVDTSLLQNTITSIVRLIFLSIISVCSYIFLSYFFKVNALFYCMEMIKSLRTKRKN